jgi:carbamoyl-phosphate synthase large subunit
MATAGTAAAFERARIPTTLIRKVAEGSPHVVDSIKANEVALVVNTTVGARSIRDSYAIRRNALLANVPYFTTIAAAMAVTEVLEANAKDPKAAYGVKSLQEWNRVEGTTA